MFCMKFMQSRVNVLIIVFMDFLFRLEVVVHQALLLPVNESQLTAYLSMLLRLYRE